MGEFILSVKHCDRDALFVETLLATSLFHHPERWPPRHSNLCLYTPRELMHRPLRSHARVKLNLPESAFVTRHVLLQKSEQCLSLLGAHINPLEILDLNVGLSLLLQCAEDQEEVPDIDPHLHAVG